MAILKNGCWGLLFLLSATGFGQSVEEALAGTGDCSDIERRLVKYIPEFYNQNQPDSIELLLDYMSSVCIESEPLKLVRFLVLIQQHRFSDTILNASDIQLLRHEIKMLSPDKHGEYNLETFNFSFIYNYHKQQTIIVYLDMLRQWSSLLKSRTNNSPLENAVLAQYVAAFDRKSLNTIWWFNDQKCDYNAFSKTYMRYQNAYYLSKSFIFGLTAGTYYPSGALYTRMGNQGIWGVSLAKHIGATTNKLQFNMMFLSGKLPLPFTILRPDTTFESNYNYKALIQFEYGHSIFRPGRFFEVHAIAGLLIAEKGIYDRTLNRDEDDEPLILVNQKMGKSNIAKPGISLGMDARFFVRHNIALASQVRYNWFNLGFIGDNDFRGNALTATFGIQIVSHR